MSLATERTSPFPCSPNQIIADNDRFAIRSFTTISAMYSSFSYKVARGLRAASFLRTGAGCATGLVCVKRISFAATSPSGATRSPAGIRPSPFCSGTSPSSVNLSLEKEGTSSTSSASSGTVFEQVEYQVFPAPQDPSLAPTIQRIRRWTEPLRHFRQGDFSNFDTMLSFDRSAKSAEFIFRVPALTVLRSAAILTGEWHLCEQAFCVPMAAAEERMKEQRFSLHLIGPTPPPDLKLLHPAF